MVLIDGYLGIILAENLDIPARDRAVFCLRLSTTSRFTAGSVSFFCNPMDSAGVVKVGLSILWMACQTLSRCQAGEKDLGVVELRVLV
jgi:hypothetical protein